MSERALRIIEHVERAVGVEGQIEQSRFFPAQLNAGAVPEAEIIGIAVEHVIGKLLNHLNESRVTGMLDRCGNGCITVNIGASHRNIINDH